jgi:hypothetical protein
MFRSNHRPWPGVALAVLASCSSPVPDPAPPDPGAALPPGDVDQTAVALGVAVVARDAHGAPRLIRAIAPRAGLAGMPADRIARDHLAALTPLWMRNRQPAALATHSMQQLRNGATLVRLQQKVGDLEIHQGELHVLVERDGSLAAISGTMVPATSAAEFRSTAPAALRGALATLFPDLAPAAITEAAADDGSVELTVAPSPAFTVERVRARRELLPEGDTLTPIWTFELFADRAGESVARRVLVADADRRVVGNVNLTHSDAFVYRALAETTGNRAPLDGPLLSYNPHPTGFPDGTLPDLGPYNLVTMEAFNAPHDPWLATTATTTSGNNVDAYADINAPVGFSAGDIRPEVRAGRVLNYVYDFTADPLATPNQSRAATVNAFFVTNWLHDWYYDSGFTEATGNAQVDNYGRGGVAGDPLVVHAQEDAHGPSRNNANMTTPGDGISPVMNMFLWAGFEEKLTTPTATPPAAGLSGDLSTFDVTGTAVLAQDPAGSHGGCGAIQDVRGKIVFVEFIFQCFTDRIIDNLVARGAIGLVVLLPLDDLSQFPLPGSRKNQFPALVLDQTDGAALEAQLPATVTLHRAGFLQKDGDLDNSIIAHEWGHYLHLRLASCENGLQCAGMSEGWGDFNSLMMMLRGTDNRDGTYSVSNYATSAVPQFTDPGYFGIRRFPYSIDRSKNPLSFRHIRFSEPLPTNVPGSFNPATNDNTEPHAAGEVWANTLWEVYNVLLDAHGFTEAHRRMSDYIVAGLLLTPPDATFTEGRDSLLTAIGALDTDDMVLAAAAFAGRGMGTCAKSPAPAALETFDDAVESGTLAALVATSGVTLSDDGVSCDHDGILDPGESGTLHVTIANHGVVAAEDVVVTPNTTSTGVSLGAPIRVGTLAPFTQLTLDIPVRISANAPTATTLDVKVTVASSAGCNTGIVAPELHRPLGVDTAAGIATTDTFEATQLTWTPTGTRADELWRRAVDATGNPFLFGPASPFPSDTQMVSPVLQVSPTAPLVVSLHQAYDLLAFADSNLYFEGGVIEVTSDGGATWRDLTELGLDPYPFTLLASTRKVFGGATPAFPARQPLVLDFGTQFAGQAVQLRFRILIGALAGPSFHGFGWELDDIAVTGITNTPFPGLVPEPTVCTANAGTMESSIAAIRSMPRHSLAGFAVTEQP